MGLLVHDVASAQPGEVAVLALVLFVLDLQESFFGFFVLSGGRGGNTKVPVEVVVVDEVGSDGLLVHEHVVKLLEDKEARGHALATGNGIALGGGGTHHLEEVLSNSHVVFLVRGLSDHSVHDSLQDVLLRKNALHVFDESVGLVNIIVFEVVDHEVKSRLGNHVDKRRKHLKSILTASEHDQVVSEQVVVLEDVTGSGAVLKRLELGLGGLSVVELIVVASLEVDAHDGVLVETEVDGQDLERHIVVVHFVVTEGDVDVDSVEVFVFNEELLVDFGCFFKMTAQIVQCRHAELIFD